MNRNPFDVYAEDYDRWFITEGREVYTYEIRAVCGEMPRGKALEIGVGTGRFAAPLGVRYGLDPSLNALRLAGGRVDYRIVGRGEELPFKSETFSVVLLIVTVCFLEDVEGTVKEVRRVLKRNGELLLGYVPRETRTGEEYIRKGMRGHRFYSVARFWSTSDLLSLLERYGFQKRGFRSVVRSDRGLKVVPWESRETVFSVLRVQKS